MSATNYKNPWVDLLATASISIISVVLGFVLMAWWNGEKSEDQDINSKASILLVEKTKKECIDHANNLIISHEVKEQVYFSEIKNIMILSNEKQDAFFKGLQDQVKIQAQVYNSRLDRLENKIDNIRN